MVSYPRIDIAVLRLATVFFQSRTRKMETPIHQLLWTGSSVQHCRYLLLCRESLSYLCITLGTQTPQARRDKTRTLSFWFFSMTLMGQGGENIMSCCSVYELVKELRGKHDDGSIRAWCIPAFIIPLILLPYLYI